MTVECRNDSVYARVRDDGVGFNPGRSAAPGHIGLAAARERVELAGGRVVVEAAPGRGTDAVFQLPIPIYEPAANLAA